MLPFHTKMIVCYVLVVLRALRAEASLPAAAAVAAEEAPPSCLRESPISLLQKQAARAVTRRWKAKATSDLGEGVNNTAIAFFQHHKCGTEVSAVIALSMSVLLGMPLHYVKWADVMFSNSTRARCIPGSVMLYEDMRVLNLEGILKDCPDLRAAHFIRSAPEVVVSNYVYTKHLKWGEEVMIDEQYGVEFRHMTLEDGMKTECWRDRHQYLPQMVATHQAVQEQGLEKILTVRYENWMDHYDNVTTSILQHMLGKGHPQLNNIFALAKLNDKSTWSNDTLQSVRHISDTAEKAEAAQKLVQMYNEGDGCARSIAVANHKLGYHDWPTAS